MIKQNKVIFLLLLALLPLTSVSAATCNYNAPVFIVDGVNQWQGLSPDKILAPLVESATGAKNVGIDQNDRPLFNYKLSLKQLVQPYSKQGTLIITTCSGKSQSFSIDEIISDESDISLVLAKKNFFKLVEGKNSKPLLKKISNIKLLDNP